MPKGLTDEKAARMLVALRNGETLRRFFVKRARFDAYCKAHPEYECEALPLLKANYKLADSRKGRRLTTHCKAGLHLMAGNNVMIDRSHGRRRCRACRELAFARVTSMSPELIRKVKDAFLAGRTLSQICFGKSGSIKQRHFYIVPYKNLKLACETDSELAALHSKAVSLGRYRGQALRHERRRIAEQRTAANDFDLISNMVPQSLPEDVRDDVIQSIFVALLDGSLQRNQVKNRVREFVLIHNREANRLGVGQYGLRSLDAPIFDDSHATLGDRVTHSLWD